MDDIDEIDEPEAEAGAGPADIPAPRANPFLVGHEAAEASLLAAAAAGRLPHAIILGGPRGIGKATLAYRLARFLLAGGATPPGDALFAPPPPTSLAVPPESPIFRRVASSGHADLFTLERQPRDARKDELLREDLGLGPESRDWEKKRALKAEIVVEDTRDVLRFLQLTSAEGGWRVVVVDSADEMNRNAANALLKILEEPPRRALLLLVAHAPGRLLPTIRSRCRRLTLKPLADETVVSLLQRYLPGVGAGEAAALARLSEGSIGRAIDLAAAGGAGLYRELVGHLGRLPELDGPALHRFADRLGRRAADGEEDAFRTCAELLLQFLTRMVAAAGRGEAAPEIVDGEAALAQRLVAGGGLDRWVEVWEKIARLFAQADGLNLERKQVVLSAFFALAAAARQA